MNTSNIEILSSNAYITASNNMTISASNTLKLAFGTLDMASTGDMGYKAQSNISFYINASSNSPGDAIFQVKPDNVAIRGDLIITGSIHTSNIINTTVTTIHESLKVTDKVITLANTGSNFNLNENFDSSNNNGGAGILIDGIPSFASSYDPAIQAAYEKSFKWNYNNATIGMEALGTNAGIGNEPTWDLKGGAFRIINQKVNQAGDAIHQVAFAFRINELDELELTKQYTSNNTLYTKRVARFGRLQ